MGSFSDSLKKWFYTKSAAAAANTNRIPLLDVIFKKNKSNTKMAL